MGSELLTWTKICEDCFQYVIELVPWNIKAVLKAKVDSTTSKEYLSCECESILWWYEHFLKAEMKPFLKENKLNQSLSKKVTISYKKN